MSMYGEPSLADLLPAYYCNNYRIARENHGVGVCKSILTHLFAMLIAFGLCLGGYYYYENVYIPDQKDNLSRPNEAMVSETRLNNLKASLEMIHPEETANIESVVENLKKQLEQLQKDLAIIHDWRATINAHLTKIQWEQDIKIHDSINEALEIFEADGIALMDYAASYAGGLIVGISSETHPHPTHRPLSLFKIVNVDVLSSPEEVIRPCVLPGSCFAFKSSSGSLRIKLGKPINIGGVTLSHASKFLLGMEGMSSAPREFEVYGFTSMAEKTGTFLGKFIYDWKGKQHQTFPIKKKYSENQVFEEVELVILSNYGKEEFTCVYRFRVHKGEAESTAKSTKTSSATTKKKCC